MWAKDIAPSAELREWFHADRVGRWPEFRKRYAAELSANPATPALLDELRGRDDIVLLTAAKDVVRCHVPVIEEYLAAHL